MGFETKDEKRREKVDYIEKAAGRNSKRINLKIVGLDL